VAVNGFTSAGLACDVAEPEALEFGVDVAAFELVAETFEVLEPDAVSAAAVPADVATNEPLTTIAAISVANRLLRRRRASLPLIPFSLRIASPFNTWCKALPSTARGGRQNCCMRAR
jgi:hypothetical protein